MDFSSPETASILLWTLMRGAALAVLATEAIFLWTRRSEPQPSPAQAASRLFWAATPAVLARRARALVPVFDHGLRGGRPAGRAIFVPR